MKHVSRLWLFAIALAFVTAAAPAFAEVQNIKIGGDFTVRGFWRDSLRFQDDRSTGSGPATGNQINTSSTDAFFQTLLGINLSADLTDQVQVDVRLINERLWGGNADDDNIRGVAGATGTANFNSNEVSVALANVTLKELFYSPLTLKMGRQNLWFGRGMIIGHRLLASDVDPAGTLGADEFTDNRGFDAIRATLDYNPFTVDAIYSKVDENSIDAADDVNLFGVNLGYEFADYNAEAEAYYFLKRSKDLNPLNLAAAPFDNPGHVNTIGVRGSVEPAPNFVTFGEIAMQFGRRIATPNALNSGTGAVGSDSEIADGDAFQAWMMNFGADYVYVDSEWTPRIGLEWRFYSGDEGDTAEGGWDPMYRGNYSTLIQEFQTIGLYLPSQSGTGNFNPLPNASTNRNEIQLRFGLKPMEDLDLSTQGTWSWAHKGIHPTDGDTEHHFLSFEWDSQLLYDYTEDVQFGMVYGVAFPGELFREQNDSVAQELVTTLKVQF